MVDADNDDQAASPPDPTASPQASSADMPAPAPDPAPPDSTPPEVNQSEAHAPAPADTPAPAPGPALADGVPPEANQSQADAPAPADPNVCIEHPAGNPDTNSPEDAGPQSSASPPQEGGTDVPATDGEDASASGSVLLNLTDDHYDWIHQMCGKDARPDAQSPDNGSTSTENSDSGGMTAATPDGASYSAEGVISYSSQDSQVCDQPEPDVKSDCGDGPGGSGGGSGSDGSDGTEGHSGSDKPSQDSSSGSESLHTILTVAGFIPEIGAVANAANAVIYAAEGNNKEAAINAMMAVGDIIPEGGQVFGGLFKGGEAIADANKAAKIAEEAEKAAKIAEEAQKAAKAAEEAEKAAKAVEEAQQAEKAVAEAEAKAADDAAAMERARGRAEKYSESWKDASAQESIDKVAGPNPIISEKGSKITYTNPETGKQVVVDKGGKYFRVRDPSISGRDYTDQEGNPVSNNKTNPDRPGKLMGKSKAEYQQETHFNNTDEN